jgi:acetyl-CoA C-acetyltransferase
MTEAYIYDAARTPRGKGRADGSLHEVTSVALSARMLNAVKERNGLEGHAVEDVIWGNVTQVKEQGGCLARSAVLLSDLDERIPGSGHQPLLRVGHGGSESCRQPGQRRRRSGLHRRRRRNDGPRCHGLRRCGNCRRPSLAMKTYFVPQGISADIIATEYGFTREQADAFAVESPAPRR